jgi:hypothetical protein
MGEFIFSPLLKTVGKPRYQLLAATIGTGLFCALGALNTEHTKGMAIAVSIMFWHLFGVL